ncbi:MAG: hypothetical protein DRI65_17290 [Chloroflexota bacterium]|nr:MAG: hypothetical protein DRI65_17290 [Chloroflexota bacterium]
MGFNTLTEEEAREVGLISDWYEIDYKKAQELGVLGDITVAKHFGGLKPVHACIECEFMSADLNDFTMVGIEEPSYSMNDPYPGYGGDPMCNECFEKHEDDATEAEISRMEYRAENPPDFGRGERYAH